MRKDLPGSMDSKEVNIVVALDTSASMSNKDLEYIFNEILAIVSKRKTSVTVIEFDTSVQRVYKILGRRDIPHDTKGRGGTAYTPLIRHINSDRRFRDSLLIIFTDGYGEDSIPRPNTYRNLWVVFDSARYLSVKQPYGAVVSLHV